MPTGPAGLAWVFPHLAGQQCGQPTSRPGVVAPGALLGRLSDGTAVQLGYYQWDRCRRRSTTTTARGSTGTT